MGIFFANSFTKNFFSYTTTLLTSMNKIYTQELVKKPACKTNLDENEIVLHSILLFFHLKAVEQKKAMEKPNAWQQYYVDSDTFG